VLVRFIDEHKVCSDGGLRWGVEPMCQVLTEHGLSIVPATYYAAKTGPPAPRAQRDEQLKLLIAALRRDGVDVGRDQVGRLMRELGLQGVRRGRPKRTTVTSEGQSVWPADLVQRNFSAQRPDQLWVCDLTYLRTWVGFAYLALVIDVFSRRIVGWALATHLCTDLPLEALEMAIWARGERLDGLVHHTDRGSQYLAIRYTATLAAVGAVPSVGSAGDSLRQRAGRIDDRPDQG
jgi:putative transposase